MTAQALLAAVLTTTNRSQKLTLARTLLGLLSTEFLAPGPPTLTDSTTDSSWAHLTVSSDVMVGSDVTLLTTVTIATVDQLTEYLLTWHAQPAVAATMGLSAVGLTAYLRLLLMQPDLMNGKKLSF